MGVVTVLLVAAVWLLLAAAVAVWALRSRRTRGQYGHAVDLTDRVDLTDDLDLTGRDDRTDASRSDEGGTASSSA
jgi:hypothetical protein